MALPDYFRVQSGTVKIFKSSGGDAAITLTSLANGSAINSDKLDLGATRGAWLDAFLDIEIAASPTAGNTIDLYWAPSSSATQATDNPGGVDGSDGAYAGYSSNLTASLPQLQFIGSMICTAQATATVQKGYVGRFSPAQRYGTLVVVNNSGAALHSSATNMQIRFAPVEGVVED